MKLFTLALGAIALSGCAYVRQMPVDVVDSPPVATLPAPLTVAPTSTFAPKPPCQGDVIAVVLGEPTDCDVSPPQRLDERYPGSDGIEESYWQGECDHSGGTLVWSVEYDTFGEFVCQGVDY